MKVGGITPTAKKRRKCDVNGKLNIDEMKE
jgi:hypothetical protein